MWIKKCQELWISFHLKEKSCLMNEKLVIPEDNINFYYCFPLKQRLTDLCIASNWYLSTGAYKYNVICIVNPYKLSYKQNDTTMSCKTVGKCLLFYFFIFLKDIRVLCVSKSWSFIFPCSFDWYPWQMSLSRGNCEVCSP